MDGRLPEEAQRLQNSAAERGIAEFGEYPTHGFLNTFENTAAASTVYGGGSNAAHGAFNRGLSHRGDLTGPHGNFSQGNYASGVGAYGGLFPVAGVGPTSTGYYQGNFIHPAAYPGNVDSGRHYMNNGLAPYAVYNQGNHVESAPHVSNVDSSLHHVDSGRAPNAVYNQGNNLGFAPLAGNVDSGLHSMNSVVPNAVYNQDTWAGPVPDGGNSFYPLNEGATGSAVPHRSVNINATSVNDGRFPLTGFPVPNAAYVGADTSHQAAVLSPQIPSLTPSVDSTLLSPSTAVGTTGTVTPNNRPRRTGVRRRWPCDVCSKTFGRGQDMRRHAKKHTGGLEFQCDVAGCRYRGSYRRDHLEQHRKNRH